MNTSERKADYAVGYGKPPAQHRFKKGQSGNPKGRPRKVTQEQKPLRFRDGRLGSLLEHEAFRSLLLQENGKTVEMTAAQAIMRSIMVDGVKGGRLAKKFALQTLRQEEQEAFQRRVDHYTHFAQMKAEGEAKITRCKEQGLPLPRLFPHPDDILLDEEKLEVHILGPLSEGEAARFERGALARDWFYARSVFVEKFGKPTPVEDGETRMLAGHVVAWILNEALPPSLQRDESSTLDLLMSLHSLRKERLRQRMESLMAEIAAAPKSIEERLTTRKRAATVIGIISEELEKMAAALSKDKNNDLECLITEMNK